MNKRGAEMVEYAIVLLVLRLLVFSFLWKMDMMHGL